MAKTGKLGRRLAELEDQVATLTEVVTELVVTQQKPAKAAKAAAPRPAPPREG